MILFYFSLELEDLRIKEEEEQEKEEEEEEDEKEEKSNINPPQFSRVSGFYPEDFKLKLMSKEKYEIYYTDDSTDPRTSNSSQKYKDYILICDKSLEPNIYSAIGNSGNVIYINPERKIVVAVASYFKPTIFDRVDFIQEYIEPYL